MMMKFRPVILLILAAMLLVAGTLAVARHARASDRCPYGSCFGSTERLFGPRIGGPDVINRGYESWNDIYNQRNQERYKAGTKAEPFDYGSPTDPTGSLAGARKPSFTKERADARNEHVRWCLKRYRSYAIETDTYVNNQGRTRFCDSPFN